MVMKALLVLVALALCAVHVVSFRPSVPLKNVWRMKSIDGFALRDVRYEFQEEESLDDALKYFRQACSQSGHLQALRIKDQHENASEKRKRKREQAQFVTRMERNNERYERQYSDGPYNFDRK